MFIHPQPPHRHISAPCVFAFTPVSGVFFPPRRDTVCVCCMNAAQWLACEVADSFITACAHRETAAFTRRREEDGDSGQAGFTVGPVRVSSAVSGKEGWEDGGTAAVSFNEHSLLSSAFNLQARPAPRPVHPRTKGREAEAFSVGDPL